MKQTLLRPICFLYPLYCEGEVPLLAAFSVLYSCSISPFPHPPSQQQLIGQRCSRFKSKSICFDLICSKFGREPWTLVHLYSSMLFSPSQKFFRFEETQTFLPFIRRYVTEVVLTCFVSLIARSAPSSKHHRQISRLRIKNLLPSLKPDFL